jgi:hypothetical protein
MPYSDSMRDRSCTIRAHPLTLIGVDFTSAPSRRKPIVAAIGRAAGDHHAVVDRIEHIATFDAFESLLARPGPWIGGFDFPFGLARPLVESLGWPRDWPALIRHYAALDRRALTTEFDAFRASRPVGDKYARRATELAAGAHASMKLVNPPVAWMLHEGAPRLLDAGVCMPTVHDVDCDRIALEAYPGFVFRPIPRGRSYKSDAARKRTPERERLRARLLGALAEGDNRLGVRLRVPAAVGKAAIADASGDTLDALACVAQAAWSAMRRGERYGLPSSTDALEGWIAGS